MIRSPRELVLSLLGFLTLALVWTWPLATHMTRWLPVSGEPVEPLSMLYGITWGVHALAENPFRYFDAPFFYPYDASLSLLDQTFGLAAIAATVNWSTGNMVLGYNVAWLATFTLSALGAYLLVRHLTDRTLPAILAAVIFAYHPFRIAHAGLINVLAVMWVPFALLSLHLWLESRRRRQLFLFVAFALLQFVSSGYGGVFLVVAVLVYLPVLLLVDRGRTVRLLTRQRWTVLAALGLTLALAAPFAAPYLSSVRAGAELEATSAGAAEHSATLLDLVRVPEDALLGNVLPSHPDPRRAVFPGAVALLAVAGLVTDGRERRRRDLIAYAALAVTAYVLALGPRLGDIPMPFAAARAMVPGLSFIHVPSRFALLGLLAVSILAGWGLARVQRRLNDRRQLAVVLGVVVILAALGEYRPGELDLIRPLPRGIPGIYSWLETGREALVVAELPMPGPGESPRAEHAAYALCSLAHKNRLVNGIAPFAPPVTRRVRAAMQTFPDEASITLLRNLGVTYVLVHLDQYTPGDRERIVEVLARQAMLNPVQQEGETLVLELVAVSLRERRAPPER